MTLPTIADYTTYDALDSADARLREARADGQADETPCPVCGLITGTLDLQPMQGGGWSCWQCFFAGWKLRPLDDEVTA